MLAQYKIVCDEWAEVWDLLKPYADQHFWQWSDVECNPGAVYILGANTIQENYYDIIEKAQQYPGHISRHAGMVGRMCIP